MELIDFYFDFGCPYSYLAYARLSRMARGGGVDLRYHAVDVEQVKRAAGNDGPALRDIPAKRRYVEQDARRWARRYGIPFFFTDEDGARAALGMAKANECGVVEQYVAAVFHALWAETGARPGATALDAAAEAFGWPAADFRASLDSPRARADLAARCRAASERGVFGVPTFVVGENLYWGNDRLELVESAVARQGR